MRKVDWSQFDDWLTVGGPGGDWPLPTETKELTEQQKQVVVRNAELLLDREAWQGRVEVFEAAIRTVADEAQQIQIREKYYIRLDRYDFDREIYPVLDFYRYVFPCSVSFNYVDFCDGGVNFVKSQFKNGTVSFKKARFGNGNVNFSDVKIRNGFIFFTGMQLSKNTKFVITDMIVHGSFFLKSNFLNSVSFEGLKVSDSAVLSNSFFKKCPDFRDAEFGRPPDVGGIKLDAPEMSGKKMYYFFTTCFSDDEAAKYRKLKAMALAANDHDKDGEFFAYEMMAKRGHEITGFWELLANSFYYHVSNYGQSWMRPLVGVFISWFVFTFIYLNSVATILKAGSLNFSAIYSALNSFPFLSSLHRLTLKPQDYEGSLEKTLDTLAKHDGVVDSILNWAMFQQFIGIVLLFFLLLGLRNRFRLK